MGNIRRDRASRCVFWILAAACLFYGCAGAGGRDETDGGQDEIDAGTDEIVVDLDPCGFADAPAALIDVSVRYDVFHSGAYARIEAKIQDGPYPTFHEVAMEEGGCRYLKVAYGNCDPACPNGEVCVIGDVCVPYPSDQYGGTLTIVGLGDPIELEPEDWSPGTYTGPAGLPADLFDSSDTVGADLAGDDFPALTLGAKGVATIDPDLTENGFEMVDSQDAEITWTPGPDPNACMRVVINGFNQAHGAPLADIIECEGPDTGSLTIPQSFVEEFPHGATPEVTSSYDWPHSELTRYTRSSKEVAEGPARLIVRSTAYFLTSHPE
jgi:hypothetical protein